MNRYDQFVICFCHLLLCSTSPIQILATRSVSSTVSGNFSTNSPVYTPPHHTNAHFYYQAFQVKPEASGVYNFISDGAIETYQYLYNSSMDPSVPEHNLIVTDDASPTNRPYKLLANLLRGQTYVLLITTRFPLTTGSFFIATMGPQMVRLLPINSTTSRPIPITMTTTPRIGNLVTSAHAGHLTPNHPEFHRPGSPSRSYFYETWQLRAHITGLYRFTTESAMDTFGGLYYDRVDLSNPDADLIIADDDSGENNQFEIVAALQYRQTYILLVTTSFAATTGNYTLKVSGPAPLSVTLFTLTTISSIQTTTTTATTSLVDFKYSGSLSSHSSIYTRYPFNNGNYYYQAFQARVQMTGIYTLRSNSSMKTVGYLYYDPFDFLHPERNLITYDDPIMNNEQFALSLYLQYGTLYILVITTSSSLSTGSYSIYISGLDQPYIETYVPTTSQPSPTTLTVPAGIIAIVNGSLTSNSRILHRTSHKDQRFYYEAFQFTIMIAGMYTFTSRSSINIFGYLYRGPMDPVHLTQNLIISDDDGAGNGQFLITTSLANGQTYVLLVTTYAPNTMGNFSVDITGPESISLTSFTPTTSKPARKTNAAKLTDLEIVAIAFGCLIFCLMVYSVWLHQRRRRMRDRREISGAPPIFDRTSPRAYVLTNLRCRAQQVQGSSELDPAPAYTARVHCVEAPPPSYEQFVASLKDDE